MTGPLPLTRPLSDAGVLDRAWRAKEIAHETLLRALAGTAEHAPPSCALCHRPAYVVQRGVPLCAICALVERTKRR